MKGTRFFLPARACPPTHAVAPSVAGPLSSHFSSSMKTAQFRARSHLHTAHPNPKLPRHGHLDVAEMEGQAALPTLQNCNG